MSTRDASSGAYVSRLCSQSARMVLEKRALHADRRLLEQHAQLINFLRCEIALTGHDPAHQRGSVWRSNVIGSIGISGSKTLQRLKTSRLPS